MSKKRVITGSYKTDKSRGLGIKWHRVNLNHLTTFHVEVSWELIRVVHAVGEGGEGIKIPSSRGLLRGGDGKEKVMVCEDDTICLLVGLSCQNDPERDTRARGWEVVSDQLDLLLVHSAIQITA